MLKIESFLSVLTPANWFQIDRRSLELFRIYVCIWTFRDLILRLQDFEAFHCVTGLLNDEDFTRHGFWLHRLLFYRGSFYYQSLLFLLHFIVTVLFFVGYRIKLTSVLHFILTISLSERNYYFTDGGDKLFRHLAFWAALLPTQHYLYYYNEKNGDINTNDFESNFETQTATDAGDDSVVYDSKSKQSKTRKTISNGLKKRRKNGKSKSQSNSKFSAVYDSNNSVISHHNKATKQNRVWSKYHSGYTGMAILFQGFVVYPAVMMRRYQNDPTWSWNNCSAIHTSLSLFQMIHPNNNLALYFAGQFPQGCFYACRLVVLVECIVPLLLLFCAMFPSNYKKLKKLQLLATLSLMMMHGAFAIGFRLSNFVWSGTLSLVPFIPSYFWDEFFVVEWMCKLFNWIMNKLIGISDSIRRFFGWIRSLFVSDSEILNVSAKQGVCYQLLGIFFCFYIIMNNLGDFHVITKPDEGNIGELLILSQNWHMFVGMIGATNYYYLVAEIETSESNSMEIVFHDFLTNDYKHAQMYVGHELYPQSDNGRPFNPVSLSPSMRWERIFKNVQDKPAVKKSMMDYFCKQIKQRSPMNIQVREYNRSRDGSEDEILKSYNVTVERMIKLEWCLYLANIVPMWQQPGGQWAPTYKNEIVRCDIVYYCPV